MNLLNLLNVSLVNVSADVLDAEAHVDSVNGACVLSSNSSVASALIQVAGKPITSLSLLTTPLDIPILDGVINVATLHLNATLGGPHPTFGPPNLSSVTQRALWLQVVPLLGLTDVVVGEATADFAGVIPAPTNPRVVWISAG